MMCMQQMRRQRLLSCGPLNFHLCAPLALCALPILLPFQAQFSAWLPYRKSILTFLLYLIDASKATFTASPSSCFLASRNKSGGLSNDSTVKNECLQEQTYSNLSPNQHAGLVRGLHSFSNEDNDTVPLTGSVTKCN